jgi:hypothetical protein
VGHRGKEVLFDLLGLFLHLLESCNVCAHYDELVVVIDELGFHLEVPLRVF